MALLIVLSLTLFLAALCIAVRHGLESRAELLLTCVTLWNFGLLVPIHLLGLLGRLTPAWLAFAVGVISGIAISASSFKTEPRQHFARVRDRALELVRLPFDALVETFRAGSFAFVGLIACFGIILYTAWLSYLLPSDSWDGVWYHELMIGYALQNQGYAPIALPTDVGFPANMIQQANGYPRNCDMTNLWFVIFSGRDLVEVVNSYAEIPLMLATYCIGRRVVGDKSVAIGWAAAVATIPAVTMQLRSTYIDTHVAAFYLTALHFCTRPGMRLRDAWMGVVSLALLIGAKSMTLASVPVLWLALGWLAFRTSFKPQKLGFFATLAGGSLLVVAMASVTYVRNWVLFKNPIWPMSLELHSLGLSFKGLAPVDAIVKQQGEYTLAQSYKAITEFHAPGHDFADTGAWAYGDGVAFVVVPLGVLAFVMLVVHVIRRRLPDPARAPEPRPSPSDNLLLVSFCLIAISATAPKLWYPRYNIHLAAGLMFLLSWLMRNRPRFSEAVIGATLLANLLFLYRASPGWGVTFEQARAYASWPAEKRDLLSPSPFSITPEVAAARDRELGPGVTVAFAADVVFVFVAQLWNERYTNKLLYVPPTSTDAFVAGAERFGARWVVVGEHSSIARDLRARPAEWQEIGKVSRGYPSVAFRKL